MEFQLWDKNRGFSRTLRTMEDAVSMALQQTRLIYHHVDSYPDEYIRINDGNLYEIRWIPKDADCWKEFFEIRENKEK